MQMSAKKSRHAPDCCMHVFFVLQISQGSRRVQGSMLWGDVRSNYPLSPQAHYSDSAGRRRRVVKMPQGDASLLFQQHVHCPPQEFDKTFEKGTKASISRLVATPCCPLMPLLRVGLPMLKTANTPSIKQAGRLKQIVF